MPPEMKTAPSAVCHGTCNPSTTVYAKYAVETHSGRLRERIPGHETHQQAADRGRDRRDHEQLRKSVRHDDRASEHLRIDEEHVRHREKRRESGT